MQYQSHHEGGFSLIEMITVIVLIGIIGVAISRVLTRPIEGFVDLSQRAELVDIAELTLRRMSREIRLALPNSVRLTNGTLPGMPVCVASGGTSCAIEILRTSEGGRYRAKTEGGGGGGVCGGALPLDRLSFTSPNDCFEVLGTVANITTLVGANQNSCLLAPRTSDCLVIFNTGQSGANAYNGDNIAGIDLVTVVAPKTAITFDISGSGVTRFPLQSPRQRFHIVDMPVSFVCDTTNEEITREAEYSISITQSINPGGTVSLLANRISACTFIYSPGTSSRNGILTVDITISALDTQGTTNNVRLIEQIQVPNIP